MALVSSPLIDLVLQVQGMVTRADLGLQSKVCTGEGGGGEKELFIACSEIEHFFINSNSLILDP